MSQDKEFEIQLQFLDEAQEYLNTLEDNLLGLANHGIDTQKINAALRSAHSIKGGAGMMQFQTLSQLAHRLEDALKVLKVQKHSIDLDRSLEELLLSSIDALRQAIGATTRGFLEGAHASGTVDPDWLRNNIQPIFDALYERLGEPEAEDAASMLSPEDGHNVLPLFFETEVEGCLQRLEGALANHDPRLLEEVLILAQELAGLGEMLQLQPFVRLCESVTRALETAPTAVEEVTHAALRAWRRSQALVLTNHLENLPTTLEGLSFEIPESDIPNIADVAFTDLTDEAFVWEALGTVAANTAERWPERPPTIPLTPELGDLQPLAQPAAQKSARRVLEVKPDTTTTAIPDPVEANVRVPMKQLNLLNDLLGELTVERNSLDLKMKRMRELVSILGQRLRNLDECNLQLRTACDRITTQAAVPLLAAAGATSNGKEQLPTFAYTLPDSPSSRFDALEMDRYSSLYLLSQEVMETIVQIQEVSTDIELEMDETEQTTRELNKTARQLQRGFTQVRMRPLSDVVDRFPRALRELSLQYGKPVDLRIYGGNTLIDRNILEALNEPLMHLLRNAFDHGIESPEVRQATGKPEQGTIEIHAAHRSNRTLITIRDDGRGIPIEKIRARARQMGLDEGLLAAASDEELLSLIFEPGFSTSDRVTDLSGRGVGMDVVRNQLKQVRGDIQVETEAGKGTTFTLSVPYNLSITRVVLAESNGLQMAFPSDTVEEMLTLEPEQIISADGGEVFEWHGQGVQLVRLRRWLQFHCPRYVEEFEIPPSIDAPTVVMVTYNGQPFGLEIDRSWGDQEVAVRQVEGNLGLPPGFSGCTILGDGRVVPLISVTDLMQWILSERSHVPTTDESWVSLPDARLDSAAPPNLLSTLPDWSAGPRTILVVDDSVNVRRFLALTLEKVGYRVEQAKDGQDAIDRLNAGLQVQAVVCDIEMPRLDGYGFLAQMQAHAALNQIPVTMLTSRSSEKHRQLAMSLGAAAYFSKPYNEQELLQSIAKLIQQ
jgi:chemotaxis family two-component system sensor histidine kinase/response regulator PixL